MKNLKTILALISLLIVLASCKKEETIVPVVGRSYAIKGDIFNKGAYQPKQPVLLIDLYTGPNGIPYAHCKAQVDWNNFAVKSGSGVADQTIEGNKTILNQLNTQGIYLGDASVLTWDIPQYDLKQN